MKKAMWVLIVLMAIGLLQGCTPKEFYPDSGEWYCQELELQLAFGQDGECFAMINGEKMTCACGADRGSQYLSVGCQEVDCEYCSLGEEIFGAYFVSLDGDTLVLKTDDGTEYKFLRVE
mgnify:CR=1 FL=1